VFRAIGYRGIPLPGVPFDERAGVIPNEGGRVLDPASGAPLPGEYVVGWIKRGPSGVIGTNKKDAQETVDAMLADLSRRPPSVHTRQRQTPPRRCAAGAIAPRSPRTPDAGAVEALLRSRQPELVTYSGWEAIDRHERALGEPAGRPRVKLTRIEELLRHRRRREPPSAGPPRAAPATAPPASRRARQPICQTVAREPR
jgi:ferredoxin--NADP+ reductase